MLQKTVRNFVNEVPGLYPDLLGNAQAGEILYNDDTALIPFELNASLELEDVLDTLEDQMELTFLYHFVPSEQTSFGQQVCAYSDCNFGHMYKVHLTTNGAGKVDRLLVTIYSSIEVMCSDLITDLDLHENKGKLKLKRDKAELLVEFC